MKTPTRGKTSRTPAKKIAKPAAPKKAVSKKSAKKIAKKSATKKIAKKVAAGTVRGSSKKIATKKTPVKKSAKKIAKKAAVRTRRASSKKAAKKIIAPVAPPRRPKSFAAPEIARDFGFPAATPGLPETYGEDRLMLMIKDPEYLFAYWEITPESLAVGEKAKKAGEEYREAMRINWEARELFDANYTLLPVSFAARRWYLRAPHSGMSYRVELGWLSDQGHFISLLGSNQSDAPESWSATRRRLKKLGAATRDGVLEYNLRAARPLGASESGFGRTAPVIENPDFGAPGSLGSSFGSGAKPKA